jgi:hypothetical protein
MSTGGWLARGTPPARRSFLRQLGGALAFRLWNAEPAERTRHGIACVIGDDQKWRWAVFIAHRDRGRIIGR